MRFSDGVRSSKNAVPRYFLKFCGNDIICIMTSGEMVASANASSIGRSSLYSILSIGLAFLSALFCMAASSGRSRVQFENVAVLTGSNQPKFLSLDIRFCRYVVPERQCPII